MSTRPSCCCCCCCCCCSPCCCDAGSPCVGGISSRCCSHAICQVYLGRNVHVSDLCITKDMSKGMFMWVICVIMKDMSKSKVCYDKDSFSTGSMVNRTPVVCRTPWHPPRRARRHTEHRIDEARTWTEYIVKCVSMVITWSMLNSTDVDHAEHWDTRNTDLMKLE